MGKKNKEQKNYLDFVPIKNVEFQYEDSAASAETDAAGCSDGHRAVILFVENKGVFNWIAQKFFHRPRVTQVHLDKMGNFIWPLMDGEKSIYEIAAFVKNEFGEEAEPLYERLVQYMKTLESYGFIRFGSEAGAGSA